MRARTLAVLYILITATPVTVHAEGELSLVTGLIFPQNETYGQQTALKPGDSFELHVYAQGADFTVSADLSELGIDSAIPDTASGPYLGGSYFLYPYFLTVGSVNDGIKQIPISVSNSAGHTGTTTVSVVVDSAIPELLLTSLTFATTSPKEGDTMYVSGEISGTGTEASVVHLTETAYSLANGDDATGCFGPIGYSGNSINEVLEADGTFTAVLSLFECGRSGHLSANADSLTLTMLAYDMAGNFASTSINAIIPKISAESTASTTDRGISSILFIPGTQASRLYVRDENGVEEQLWEPAVNSDIENLALNEDGSSKYQIYTKDIVDSLYGNSALGSMFINIFGTNAVIYKDFAQFLDNLVASTTLGLKEWRAYPYDWRQGVRDVVNNGTPILIDGSIETIFLMDVLRAMASTSATGKVTLIGHSNGGLIAKALMTKLDADGQSDLVDKLITVGTPHWGTPVDIGVMLHGDGGTRGLGLVSRGETVRAASKTMPGPYDLLPSSAYFSNADKPVALFGNDSLSKPYKDQFPNGITSFADLAGFITNAFNLNKTENGNLNDPITLSPNLVNNAKETHEILDTWVPPEGIEVTTIAGWGQLTTYGYRYSDYPGHKICEVVFGSKTCKRYDTFVHTALKTEDGDGTVIAASASAADTVFFFNARDYGFTNKISYIHKNLTSALPIQNLIINIISNIASLSLPEYVQNSKPYVENDSLIKVGGMSPVNVVATDQHGNRSGVVPLPELPEMFLSVQDIPGSSVDILGEEKFVYLAQGEDYTLELDGYEEGIANIQIEYLDENGDALETTTLADIPVTENMTASFSLLASNSVSQVNVDTDGNGSTDITLSPVVGSIVAYEQTEAASNTRNPESAQTGDVSPMVENPPVTIADFFEPVPSLQKITEETEGELQPEVEVGPSSTPQELIVSVKKNRNTPPPQDVSLPSTTYQTASALNALSQSRITEIKSAVYHWLKSTWNTLIVAIRRFI